MIDVCWGIKSLTFLEYPMQSMSELREIQKLEFINCQHQWKLSITDELGRKYMGRQHLQ